MKTLIITACLICAAVVLTQAQSQDSTRTQQTLSSDRNRQPIQASELPDPIRTSLQSQDFSGWAVAQAYRGTQTNSNDETKNMEVYYIELRNGAEVKTIKFDKDGNNLDKDK